MDLFLENKCKEALAVLDGIDLLPQNENEVSRFVNGISNLHPAVRKVTDDVLLNTMECMKREYTQRKNEAVQYGGNAQTNANRDMSVLRARAQALVSYGIQVSSALRPNTPAQLSKVESALF